MEAGNGNYLRYDKSRATAAQGLQAVLNLLLRLGIDSTSGFIQQDDGGILENGSSYGHAL